MNQQFRGNGRPLASPSLGRCISTHVEAAGLQSKAGTPDVVQWFGLREADSVDPLSQNVQEFSARGAFLVGTLTYSVVLLMLLLFFRTLTHGFLLQHQVTLLSGHAASSGCAADGPISSATTRRQPPSRATCCVAWPAACLYTSPSSSRSSTRRKVCSRGTTLSRPSHVCLCSLPMGAARVLRSGAERTDAGPAFSDTVHIFFSADAGVAAVGSNLSLDLLDTVCPSTHAPPIFGIFFNARLGPRECAC